MLDYAVHGNLSGTSRSQANTFLNNIWLNMVLLLYDQEMQAIKQLQQGPSALRGTMLVTTNEASLQLGKLLSCAAHVRV